MSSSFSFIPRSVSKKATRISHKSVPRKPEVHVPQSNGPSLSTTHQKTIPSAQTRDTQFGDEELLILMEAALSDYSFWCSPQFQREMKSGQDGYIPLKHVLTQSTLFETLHTYPSEADIMRCIRDSPSSTLETRMLITEPSRSEWFNQSLGASSSHQSEGSWFEIRRKDWENLLQTLANCSWNKEWWDQRTVYIERLPVAYRSIHALARYIHLLLTLHGGNHPTTSGKSAIQSILFPSHHLASYDKPSRCKGFAFIVLGSPALVNILCQSYPWDESSSVHNADDEAVKFGMRVLPKVSWEELKVEYLAYRQHLLSKVAEQAATLQDETEIHESSSDVDLHQFTQDAPMDTQPQPTWFPQGCLVFVRNIHPDTNRTTLRALFNNLATSSNDAVDYVDFAKGIDTCHLRLASPSDVAHLVSHFTTHQIAQVDALDQVGSAPTSERPRIELDIVKGKREELYWDKVPEKVRNSAVARLHGVDDPPIEENEGGRQRKRRKKG